MSRRDEPVFVASRDAEHLDRLAGVVGVELGDARPGLLRYAELVAAWTRRVDLVATRGAAELSELLFLDALVLHHSGWLGAGARLVDVGAGGGAPTVPLALLRPDLEVVLVEPRQKRCAFLRTALAQLGLLDRGVVVQRRAEPDGPKDDLGELDLAISRATFAPEEWVPLGLSLAPSVCALLGSAPWPQGARPFVEAVSYEVPSNRATRRLLRFER